MNGADTSTRRALLLSFTRTGASLVFNVATVVIVSRLLTPAQIGVFSVALALVALVQMLRSFGVGELIIQERNLTPDIVRTAFTVNLAIAGVLASAVFGFSDLIGRFYGDPGVAHVTRVLSFVFLLMPFGVITMARMKREMQFGVVVRIQLVSTAVQSTTTIALAYLGFSYMSMAWAAVASMSASAMGCLVWGGQHRVRGLGLSEWKRVLHFGMNRTVADIVEQFGEQSANIVVGRMLGMADAGFYSRGYGTVNMFRSNVIGAISSVAFPAYARDNREANAAPFLYRKSLAYITGISWPFFAFCIFMAYPLVRIAFGDQWDAAVPLMRWLCGAAMVGTLVYQCNWLLTAIGRYREVTHVEIQYQSLRVVLAVLAAFYSVEAVAASQVVVYVAAAFLYYRKLARYPDLRLRPVVKALTASATLTVATCMVPAAVFWLWLGASSDHYVSAFLVSAGGAGIAWMLSIFVFKHPLSFELGRAWTVLRERLRIAPRLG